MIRNVRKQLYLLTTVLLMSLSTPTQADNFGLTHGASVIVIRAIANDVNTFLFEEPVANFLTDVETAAVAYYWCSREADARGTWDVTEWPKLTGDYDSTFDCITPVLIAGAQIYSTRNGPVVSLINIEW